MRVTGRVRAVRRVLRRPAVVWGVGAYLLTVVVLLVRSLQRTDGALVYALDDAAIHLSMGTQLAQDGTWGVVPGEFQSASSSPLWTTLVAAYDRLVPLPLSTAPLVLNVLAGLAVVALVTGTQSLLRPSRRRPLDAVAVVGLVVVPLFLPALVFVGMEHTLHVALVLLATWLFARCHPPSGRLRYLPYGVVALAVLARLETTFVVAGICLALLLDDRLPTAVRWRRAVAAGAAGALPLAAVMVWTRANGQGWLPNSVLAKAATDDDVAGNGVLSAARDRLAADPLLAVLLVAAIGIALTAAPRLRPERFVAVVLVVAGTAHLFLARVGWYERYQAYLIALGTWMVLRAGGKLVRPSPASTLAAPAVVVAATLLLTPVKLDLTREVPTAVFDSYAQRYQAGLFLERYYDGRPVATGELGYISLFHDGPLTDLYGLGDHEVLEARLDFDQQPPAEYWEALADERGFEVVAVYPLTLFLDTPDSWILVGTWKLEHSTVSAFQPEFQFWATTPDEVEPLIDHLQAFELELPDGAVLELDELATLRADQLREAAG